MAYIRSVICKKINLTTMKKTLSFVAFIFSMIIFAQTCGFDQVQADLEAKFPEVKKSREMAEANLLQTNLRAYLDQKGATSKNGLYTGTIYEIPVVVHVITSTDASNSGLSLTDAQINTWINNANKMYATTYGGNFSAEGTGSLDGNVIPFKLVLAKRTPQCTASTGIVRYNGSTITGYDANGVNSSQTNGATTAQIRALAPHWPENAYFNIYIVLGFDGSKGSYGLMGWCGFPSNPDSSYESFMRVTVVTNANDSTLAHEFGHGLGLHHPFNGANSSPGSNPTAADCPTNANCLTDNDLVCDTAPTASLLSVFPTPTNSAINPCTGTNYEGVQNNIMNYTYLEKKFTAGQRDRGIAFFLPLRENLTKSLGGTDLATNPGGGTLVASNCNPAGITNSGNYGMGPLKVVLGNINNSSGAYSNSSPLYYVDYSAQNCISKSVYTDISATAASQLSVSFATNSQYIKAWIDYNNNGIFETSELIGTSGSSIAPASSPYVINFTPPATAVLNTYLRMRVIVDGGNTAVCANLNYGQAEDYSVRLTTTLATSEVSQESSDIVVYTKENNKLVFVKPEKSKGFGDYEIYDMSGKIIQKGSAKKEIQIERLLPKSTYILKYQDNLFKFMN